MKSLKVTEKASKSSEGSVLGCTKDGRKGRSCVIYVKARDKWTMGFFWVNINFMGDRVSPLGSYC